MPLKKLARACGPDQLFLVELPGIEPGPKTDLNWDNREFTTRNDAEHRKTTCGYAEGVDGINTGYTKEPRSCALHRGR